MKSYECPKCKQNIGWIGKWLFFGLLHKCPPSLIKRTGVYVKIPKPSFIIIKNFKFEKKDE